MSTTTCNATKKDGKKCCFKSKPGSCFCGVHKNYIDTSKPLFSEDIKDEIKKEQTTIKFMDGSNIMVDKGQQVFKIYEHIMTARGNGYTEEYQLFRINEEDSLKEYDTVDDEELFCLFEEVEESRFKTNQVSYLYSKGGDIKIEEYNSRYDPQDVNVEDYGKESQYTMCREYEVIKRTKCFVMISSKVWFQTDTGIWWSSINTSEYKVKIYGSDTCDEWFVVPHGHQTVRASQFFDNFGDE